MTRPTLMTLVTALVLVACPALARQVTPLDVNLLANAGGESGTVQGSDNGSPFYSVPGWTNSQGIFYAQTRGWYDIPSFAGRRFLRSDQNPVDTADQTVPITLPGGGPFYAVARAAIRNWDTASDSPELILDFLNSSGGLISTQTTGVVLSNQWAEHHVVRPVPAQAASIRIRLRSTRTAGGFNDGYFDDAQLILTSGQPLVPKFSVAVTPGTFPPLVTFTDLTAGAVTARTWSFGDGTTGAGQQVVHQYTTGGDFDVRLTVDSAGRSDTVLRVGAVAADGPAIIKGPYLQFATQDGMTVMWETSAVADSTVFYTDNGPQSATDPALESIHELRLGGFAPNQQVPYRVRSAGAGFQIESQQHIFTTAPTRDTPHRVCIWGDNHVNPGVFSQLVTHMLADQPNLLAAVGDVVNDGENNAEWDVGFLGPLRPILAHTPLIVAIGNHERDAHWFYDYMSQPGNEHWFGFTWASTRYVVMDPNYPFRPGTPQYAWLVHELFSPETQSADWVLTLHHQPAFSEIYEEPVYADLRRWIIPLFEQAGSDLDLTGHIHDYERGIYTPPSTGRRMAYVQTSGAGGGLWMSDDNPIDWPQIDLVIQGVHHYSRVDITGQTLHLDAIDLGGQAIDSFTLQRLPRPVFPPPEPSGTATQWDFEQGNLAATFGPGVLEYLGNTASLVQFGTTAQLGIPDIHGVPAHVMRFPRAATPTIGVRVRHGAPANGGGAFVNNYSLVMDMLIPASSVADQWLAFLNTNETNANDADVFSRLSDGAIGISGVYQGILAPDTWHRIALVFQTTGANVELIKYVDGAEIGRQSLGARDGRWAVFPGAHATPWFLLFTDNNGESASAFVSSLYFTDTALSGAQVARLRGADTRGIYIPECRADFNEDGAANSQDFFDFLTMFFAAAPSADFNDDGVINSQDFFDFLATFFAGCP